MKWAAAGLLGLVLFLAWPYYACVELTRAIVAGDAETVNRRVDWDSVRPSIKRQIAALAKEYLGAVDSQKSAHPAKLLGTELNLETVNAFIDKTLTPEGIVRLAGALREAMGRNASDASWARALPGWRETMRENASAANWARALLGWRDLLGVIRFAF